VVPRAHDCITLLLGSKERYAKLFGERPGTYWYSAGWLEIGKDFPMSPWTAMYCMDFDEPHWMLWRGSETAGTWLWYLDPIDETQTRLITRMRDTYRWRDPLILPQQILTELGDLPFMRKCLLGVRARAERLARLEADASVAPGTHPVA